jgi:hypothetical protein
MVPAYEHAPNRVLPRRCGQRKIAGVEAPPLIDRREVVAMLFAVADLNVKLERILELLEEEFGGGEALQENDA